MEKLIISTNQKEEVIDIGEKVENFIKKLNFSDARLCNLFLIHTTAALATADLDPGTDLDILDALREMIPKLKYRHPHNPEHVGDHILSTIIGQSLLLPLDNGKLVLGTWQKVVLLEFDGPRKREIYVTLI
jgi:secondary thiamine-phosphate synthase enzyme